MQIIKTQMTTLHTEGLVMTDNFIKGFNKTAFLSLKTLLTIIAPSIQKRYAQKSFEYSKRKAMGLTQEPSKLLEAVDKHIDNVRNLPPGFRKKTQEFLMDEGPGLAIYAPARNGKEIGEVLNSATEAIPFGLGKKPAVKNFLADLTSVDSATSAAAKAKLDTAVEKAKSVINTAGTIGALGALTYGGIKGYESLTANEEEQVKKEEHSAPPYMYNYSQS